MWYRQIWLGGHETKDIGVWVLCEIWRLQLVQAREAGMELAHSLLLNEEALSKIPDNKKNVFVFEWLRFLDKVLAAAQKVSLYVYTCRLCYIFNTTGKSLEMSK